MAFPSNESPEGPRCHMHALPSGRPGGGGAVGAGQGPGSWRPAAAGRAA
jgi:hypothetical protein